MAKKGSQQVSGFSGRTLGRMISNRSTAKSGVAPAPKKKGK